MVSFSFIREQRQEKGYLKNNLRTKSQLSDPAYLSRLEQDRLMNQDPYPTVGMLQRLYSVLEAI